MISTNNKIPFIVDWDGVLMENINEYLLFKTEFQWNSSSQTPKINSNQICLFLEYCYENDLNYKTITGTEIKQFVALLSKNGLKSTSIKQKLSVIESLYFWLFDNKYIIHNPFSEFGKVEVKNIVKSFSKNNNYQSTSKTKTNQFLSSFEEIEDIPILEDLKKAYQSLSKEDQLMMHLLIETGIRKEELLQLTFGMIKNTKVSKSGKTSTLFLNANDIQIKYNKSRNIMFSSNLKTKLLKHCISSNYKKHQKKFLDKNKDKKVDNTPLFISNRGNRFSTDKLNKAFLKVSKEVDITPFSPHQLRHFYASNFIYKQEVEGNNMEQAYMYLAERLGHSSPDTTKAFYVKLMNKEKMKELAESSLETFAIDFLN
jgi:integrase